MTTAITAPRLQNGELAPVAPRTTEAKVPVPLRDGQLMPADMEGVWRLANLMVAANMLPAGVREVPQAVMLLAAGFEIGLGMTQSIKGIMVVNNRPCVWGDVALGLARRSPKCRTVAERIEGEGDAAVAYCKCERRIDETAVETVERSFSVADAKKAGLWGKAGPWSNYPKRMLQMRARAFAIRDTFPDLLGGLDIAEEAQDASQSTTVTVEPSSGRPDPIAMLPDPGTQANVAPPAATASAGPNHADPVGDQGADALAGADTGEPQTLTQEQSNALLLAAGKNLVGLRKALSAFRPGEAAIVKGLPSRWPVAWKADINTAMKEMGVEFQL